MTTRQSGHTPDSIVSRFSLASLICACMLTLGVGNAWGAEAVYYTLDGTTTGGSAGYDTESDITQGTVSWKVTGNTTMNPWRIGGKGLTNQNREIYSTAAFTEDITKVEVSTGATASSLILNSITLTVSTAQNGGGTVTNTETKTSNLTSNTITFSRPNGQDWSGKYFTIVYNVTRASTSGNGYVTFNFAKFYHEVSGTTYTVTYDKNDVGATGTMTDSNSPYASGATVTVLDNEFTAPSGKIFDHWDTADDDSGTDYDPDDTFTISGNTTLYAQWTDAPAGVNYTLVTDVDDLESGDEIIILDTGGNQALSTTQNSNNRAGTNSGWSLSETTVTVTGSNVQVLTISPGTNNSSYWQLYTGSGYLYAASSSGNQLKTQNANNVNGEWNISITSNVASIVATGSSNRNVMQYNYNNGNPIFTCYSGDSQTALKIYKKVVPCDDPANALGFTLSPASITTDGTCTLTATGGNGGTINWSITSANAANGSFSSATGSPVTFSATAADTYTIKASQAKNGDYCKQSVSHDIIVTVPPCSTVPTVTAGSYSSVTAETATISCTSGVSSLGTGGCSISSYGFVIGTSSTPAIGGSGVTQHEVGTSYASTGTAFSKNLTGLTPNTTYYVRPYATNGEGTGYGTETSFTTDAFVCTNSIALSKGSESNGTVTSISIASLETCSETAAERQVTIIITPAECYDAPATLTYTGDGTASKVSGPTDNSNGTFSYVYQFAQNDNGSGTFGVTCTAKAAGKTVIFDAGPGVSASATLTETCDGSGVTLPSVDASGICKGWTTFAGWATASVSDSTTTSGVTLYAAGSKYTPASDNVTLYAVYSKVKAGGQAETLIKSIGFESSEDFTAGTTYNSATTTTGGSSPEWSINYGAFSSASGAANTGSQAAQFRIYNGTGGGFGELKTTSAFANVTKFTFYAKTANATNTKLSTYYSTDGSTWTTLTSDRTLTTSHTKYTETINASGVNTVYIKFSPTGSTRPASGNYAISIDDIEVFGMTDANTTYYCSDPDCCTSLEAINGAVNFTQPTSAELSWDNLGHVSSWTVKYKVHGAAEWTTLFTNKTGIDSEITVDSDGGTNNKMKAAVPTACNTKYDFLIIANPDSHYCDAEEELNNNDEGYDSGKWNVTYTLNHVVLSSGQEAGTGVLCGDYSATFAATSGYVLPASITVTGASAYTWTQGTGVLSISSANITGNITVTITGDEAAYFVNGETVFIQAESSSAWYADACVKAWFTNSGVGSAVQPTYWLFDATGTDSGKRLFATVVPASGTLNQVQLQRFASNCNDWWNSNGDLNRADAHGSNTFRSYGSSDNNIAWNATGVTLSLFGSPNSWGSSLATFLDQGAGVWTATFDDYEPASTSDEFKIQTNYNGWIGNKVDNDHQNENAVLSGMIVGSTYDVTASLNITTHALTVSKTFIKGTVSFDLQGHGSAISPLTNVLANSTITAPTAPTAAGYTFAGWYKEAACINAWDFSNDQVIESMTLYANWTALPTYTVILKDDDTELTQAIGGESVILPERAGCEGSVFAGWTKSWLAEQDEWTTTAPTIIPAGEYIPEANENLYPVYTKTESGTASTTSSVTISDYASAHSWVSETKYGSVTIDANVTATGLTNNNNGKYYSSNSSWRHYEGDGGTITIATSSGTLTSVTFTYSRSNNGAITYSGNSYNSNAVISVSGSSATFGVTHTSGDKNGNVQITAISVTYSAPSTTTSYISVPECAIFGPGRTIFIQADTPNSAWDPVQEESEDACVKALFSHSGVGGTAQSIYWLFDATGGDTGKKLYATVIPASGDVNQVTLQRFSHDCSIWNNDNGTLTGETTSNVFITSCAGNSCVEWNDPSVQMNLWSSLNSWASSFAQVMDHGNGVWLATRNNYAPTGTFGEATSGDFIIKTNYNGNIGNKEDNEHPNDTAALSDLIVGSTYNITATFDIIEHSLIIDKEFVKGTVRFDLQGHGAAIADLTNVTAGSKITAPTAPTAADYMFRGWYKEAECIHEWDFENDVMTETMTLYARWTSDKFTVTWMASGNAFGTNDNVPYGTTVSAPDPAPTASNCDGTKVFIGWTAAAYEHATDAPADIFTTTSPAITDNTTFYAVFALANGTKTYSFEITDADFNSTSYAANNNDKTTIATAIDGTGVQMEVKWTSYQVMKNSGMQWQAKVGCIYNTTNLGTVNSVNVTSTEGSYTTYYGDRAQPSGNDSGGYFQTKIGSTTGHSSKVTVTFTAPYYIGYATTCVASTQCMTPMFDPGSGTYNSAQTVHILSTTGATIYYTTDGTDPTTSSTPYNGSIVVSTNTTIKAIAVKDGLTDSEIATAVYKIRCAAPTFTPAPGTYNSTQRVAINCETPDSTIYITLDGSTPTGRSIVYDDTIDVNETMVIKAIAVAPNMDTSEVVIGKYIIADCNWYESFASCEGNGGNNGVWSGISGSGGIVADNEGWTIDNGAYGGNQCIKAGTSSKAGTATTPNIHVTEDIQYKLTFNMAPWDNGKAQFEIISGAELLDGTTSWTSAENMTALDWNQYEVYIHTTSTEVILKFSSTGKRFWLNDVCLKGLGDVKYHVTYEGNGNTGGTVPEDNTEYANNATVTVLGNTGSLVKDGYTFAGWNTAANGSGTDYEAGNTFNILHDVTLYAKWTVDAYTIAWLVNGETWTAGSPSTSATYGTQPTSIPTAPTSAECDGSKVFVGWSATENPATRPKDLFTSKYSAPFITANTTFYAVFATPAEASTQFDLYSGALTEGEYLITYNDKAMKAAVTTNRLNYETVTVTDNKISTNEPTLIWYLYKGADNYWRIYNTTAGFAAATKVKNQAVIILDGTDSTAMWTDSVSPQVDSIAYDFKNLARERSGSNPGNKWLRENGTYGFACYALGTGGSLTLYKRHEAYTDYATTCEETEKPYLIAEPTMLDFGNVAVDANVPAQTITLSGDNLEEKTITITAPEGFTVSPTSIPVTDVNGTLDATTITVTPVTSEDGTFNNNLTITYIGSDTTITINIPLILKVTPLYTITLHDLNTDDGNPQVTTIKQTTPSSAIMLPTTSPSSVCMMYGWVFAGS